MSRILLPRFDQKQKPPRAARVNWTHPLTRGLIGCWPCNEVHDYAITAKTVAPLNGEMVNPSTLPWRPSPFGNVPNYNGSMYVPFGNPFSLGTAFSVVAWANTSNVSGNRAVASFRSTSTASHIGFQLDQNGADARFIVGGATRSTGTYSTGFVANVWVHLVGIFDGTNADIYVNGVIGSHSGTYATPSNIDSLNLGAIVNGSAVRTLHWTGMIEGLLIYNRVLSIAEIQWLKLAPYAFYDFAAFSLPALPGVPSGGGARSWGQVIG